MAKRERLVSGLIACAILITNVQLNYRTWPIVWPDEALFSSPAATLAEQGVFATPVLAGLIPQMEQATLWNCPLYMVLLSAVYTVTGESLRAARTLNLAIACVTIFVFMGLLGKLRLSRKVIGLCLAALVFDMTFLRSANVARMDALALLFFLSTIYVLVRARNADRGYPGRVCFLAGLLTGLAAASHPIAIMLIPVLLILLPVRLKNYTLVFAGVVLALSPWLVYIAFHFEAFQVQFLSQLTRKFELLLALSEDTLQAQESSETGGIARVFAAQYGGTRVMMILALAVYGGVLVVTALAFFEQWRRPGALSTDGRIYLIALVVFVLVLVASEAWYPQFVGPCFIVAAAIAFERGQPAWSRLLRRQALLSLVGAGLLFFMVFTIRERWSYGMPAVLERRVSDLADATRGCKSVYLRVRPDPYFVLRKKYPQVQPLEFIPGKLTYPGMAEQLGHRLDEIDCFLLDDHDDWEPLITSYLESRRDQFATTRLDDSPGPSRIYETRARLLRRRAQ
ncbi:MAG: glycosyltransferase family 39 protein [Leptospiraceae bacterium]|nr:glycosyltransferase family 39 protein [Leptospiraceae bacterium]